MQTNPAINQLLGEPLDWQGATPPQPQTLTGQHVRLEPLSSSHTTALYSASHGAAANPNLWIYMPYEKFDSLAAYSVWLEKQSVSSDPLFFAVIPLSGEGLEQAQGTVALMRIIPEHGTVEIGHVWFGALLQKTPAATEAVYLLLRFCFELGFRRVEWKCHNSNAASQAAARRFGFSYEGVFRAHMVVKGRNRDTTWFSMLDTEWPRYRAAFESWLSPSNFDSNGQQHLPLSHFQYSEPSS